MNVSKRDILKMVKKATVAVAYLNTADSDEPFTIVGSGFCINSSGTIITCRHVVEAFMSRSIAQQIADAPPSTRSNGLQPVYPGKTDTPYVIFYDVVRSNEHIFAILCQPQNIIAKTDMDLAAIQILPHKSFPQGYPFLEIEKFESVTEGDEIGVCGFPLGNYLFEQLGTVTKVPSQKAL